MTLKITRISPHQAIALRELNKKAIYFHKHFDWLDPEDIVSDGLCYSLLENDIPIAGIGFSPEIDQTHWLQFFSVWEEGYSVAKVWKYFWENCINLQIFSEKTILSIPADDLMNFFLQHSGFKQKGNIIYFEGEKEIISDHLLQNKQNATLLPLTESNVKEIIDSVEVAFSKVWRLSELNLTRAIQASNIAFFLRDKNQSVGYLLALLEEDSIHISRIAVSPNYQSRGYGKELMWILLNRFTPKNVNAFSVNTYSNDENAVRFYQNLGFYRTNQIYPVYYLKIPKN